MAEKTRSTPESVRFFVPFTRIDPDERIVEGYCYCNPTVEADDWNLPREVLQDAAADYMRWGAVRVMHQPIAAGKASAVEFDEKGCFIRAKIVDDAEWKKV